MPVRSGSQALPHDEFSERLYCGDRKQAETAGKIHRQERRQKRPVQGVDCAGSGGNVPATFPLIAGEDIGAAVVACVCR